MLLKKNVDFLNYIVQKKKIDINNVKIIQIFSFIVEWNNFWDFNRKNCHFIILNCSKKIFIFSFGFRRKNNANDIVNKTKLLVSKKKKIKFVNINACLEKNEICKAITPKNIKTKYK